MRMSPRGVALLQSFEGCKLKSYDDGVGVWTIGWGSTKGVKPGDCITQVEADRRLREDDLPQYEKGVQDAVFGPFGGKAQISQNQFDAMVCLCYNIGISAFLGSSVARKVRLGDREGAADAFLAWNKGGKPLKVIPGLTNRRKAERERFLEPDQPIS